jgi:hypothetical protein
MKKYLLVLIILSVFSCKHDSEDSSRNTTVPHYPCGLSSPNPTYVDAKRVIKTYCVGCHNNNSVGRFLQYDQLNATCINGTFADRVFKKRDMPPSNAIQMDSCDYIILRRWYMNGHNPY